MRPNYTVRPTPRATTSPQTTPSPVLRPTPTTGAQVPGTYAPRDGAGATVTTTPRWWNTPRTGTTTPTPNVRTTPRFTRPDATTPGWTPTPRIDTTPTPTPRVDTPRFRIDTAPGRSRFDSGTTVPGVTTTPRAWGGGFDAPVPRSRVDVWSRRGRTSLDSNVTVTPRTVPAPTPRVVPTERPTFRVQPTDPREKDKDKDKDDHR
jgi:hypothetical protein